MTSTVGVRGARRVYLQDGNTSAERSSTGNCRPSTRSAYLLSHGQRKLAKSQKASLTVVILYITLQTTFYSTEASAMDTTQLIPAPRTQLISPTTTNSFISVLDREKPAHKQVRGSLAILHSTWQQSVVVIFHISLIPFSTLVLCSAKSPTIYYRT